MHTKNNPLTLPSVAQIRQDFPFLEAGELYYLDSAATSQKPRAVLEALDYAYKHLCANVHRGVYSLAEKATEEFEAVRLKTAKFIGSKANEVIFTSGTTFGINLLARTIGEELVGENDEILVSMLEHHSNIVPWQILAAKKKAKIIFVAPNTQGYLEPGEVQKKITKKTKILSFAHVSNVLGTIQDAKNLCQIAREHGILSVIDGAQGAPHLSLDMAEIGCDFYTFSSHKMLGPSGLGVLFGREKLLEEMPPFFGGGEMIEKVTIHGSTWAKPPHKFEAGTPAIAEVIGFGAAIDYLAKLDRQALLKRDQELGLSIAKELASHNGVHLLNPTDANWLGVVSFEYTQVHPHDFAAVCDSFKVCVRAGYHCAQPLAQHLKIQASIRVSPFLYNNEKDAEMFLQAFYAAKKLFT